MPNIYSTIQLLKLSTFLLCEKCLKSYGIYSTIIEQGAQMLNREFYFDVTTFNAVKVQHHKQKSKFTVVAVTVALSLLLNLVI